MLFAYLLGVGAEDVDARRVAVHAVFSTVEDHEAGHPVTALDDADVARSRASTSGGPGKPSSTACGRTPSGVSGWSPGHGGRR
jgi:hypothetical protein